MLTIGGPKNKARHARSARRVFVVGIFPRVLGEILRFALRKLS